MRTANRGPFPPTVAMIRPGSATTWALVSTRPSGVSTMPVPLEMVRARVFSITATCPPMRKARLPLDWVRHRAARAADRFWAAAEVVGVMRDSLVATVAGVTAWTEPVDVALGAGTEDVVVDVDGAGGAGIVSKIWGCPAADREVTGVEDSARPNMRSPAAVTTEAVK